MMMRRDGREEDGREEERDDDDGRRWGRWGPGGEGSSANDDDMHESDVAIFVRSDVVIDRGMPPSGDDDRLYRLVEAAAASVLDFTDDEWTNLKMLREATVTSTAVATAAEATADDTQMDEQAGEGQYNDSG